MRDAKANPYRAFLPALLANDLGEVASAADPWWTGEGGRISGVAERQQEFAMLVGRVAEQGTSAVVLIDGRRDAPDPELPGRQHHVGGCLPEIEQEREASPWCPWVRRDERDRDSRAGEVPSPRAHRAEVPKVVAVPTDDERPALLVLAAAGVAAGTEDAFQVIGRQRFGGEGADDPLPRDRPPHRVVIGSAHGVGS